MGPGQTWSDPVVFFKPLVYGACHQLHTDCLHQSLTLWSIYTEIGHEPMLLKELAGVIVFDKIKMYLYSNLMYFDHSMYFTIHLHCSPINTLTRHFDMLTRENGDQTDLHSPLYTDYFASCRYMSFYYLCGATLSM